ncbi:MAG: peptide chain release factor 1 [Patescibacteria group bacterium]
MQFPIEPLAAEHHQLETELANPAIIGTDEYVQKSQKYAELGHILALVASYEKNKKAYEANEEIVTTDPESELAHMAGEENKTLEKTIAHQLATITEYFNPADPNDNKNVILEIRPAAGGDEASLFAEELLRMYMRFAQIKGLSATIIDHSANNDGGIKEATVEITGRGSYALFKYESGVHRVQRVPATESMGRVHTSTVTVAVLPEVEEVDLKIDQADLRIDVYRASGAGGQHVNKTESAIRITHLPTGLVVTCQDGKSQHKNKEQAMKVLRSRLFEMREEKLAKERGDARRSQVGTGDRSEKIRTYNFPQSRITDHRIGESFHNIETIMEGEMEDIVTALKNAETTTA